MRGHAWIWDELGIAATEDVAAIRRAYAARLKAIDTEADPDAFITLRHARDAALAHAAGFELEPPPPRERAPEPPDEPEPPLVTRRPVEPEAEAPAAAPGEPEPLVHRRPAEPEAEAPVPDDLPELPSADLERIQAILFDETGPVSPEELEMLTRRVLAEPAAERIEIARWLEAWMAETIVQAMPRSDAMIPPVVAHFRWREREKELKRPPIIDYILERSVDPDFLIEFKPGARYDLSVAEQRQLAALGSVGTVRTSLRPAVQDAQDTDRRYVGGLLAAGIFFLPYIFAWLLLRHGHSTVARVFGLGWLALWAVLILLPPPAPPPGSPQAVATAATPPPIRFANFGDDAGALVAWLSKGQLDMERLGTVAPQLHEALVDAWWDAKNGGEDPLAFGNSVATLLEGEYCAQSGWANQGICTSVKEQRAPMQAGIRMVSADYAAMTADLEPMIASLTAHNLRLSDLELSRTDTYDAVVDRWRRAKANGEERQRLEDSVTQILRDEYCRQPIRTEAEKVCTGLMIARLTRAEAARRAGR